MEYVLKRDTTISALLILGLLFPTDVTSTWWYISQMQISSVGAALACENIPGLVQRQKSLCRSHADVMVSVSDGARDGVEECQHQFLNHRWNCSTIDKDATVFGKTMLKTASREAAFVYAISSAGVVHSITRACSKGEIVGCTCDNKKGVGQDNEIGEFEWGGCSQDVKFASTFSRRFIDAKEKKDARAQMNRHNNRCGRKAVMRNMKLECKCHGVSGACTIRTCWKEMKEFRRVGDYIRIKFNGATQVTMNQDGTKLILADSNHKKPTKNDLVYFEESPDYCVADSQTGSLGTAGRICNKTSLGTDGCEIMCCGRGYNTVQAIHTEDCECKFNWCCTVSCRQCTEVVDKHICKSPKEDGGGHSQQQSNSLNPKRKSSRRRRSLEILLPRYDNPSAIF